MAPRPEDDALTEPELAELQRNLLLLSGRASRTSIVTIAKRMALSVSRTEKRCSIVTAWKVLREWK